MANKEIIWDVKIGDDVKFFDPEMSYEHTGYRPITMTKGLDFVKDPFIAVGVKKDATGRYTMLPPNSKTHRDWWLEQHNRIKQGYAINNYRVTGDHYFFLNFYRLLNVSKVVKAGEGREETMPQFWAKHYEYFHYVELCEILKHDVIALKARGVGFSEIAASLGVGKYSVVPSYKVIYTAFAENFLLGDGVLQKVWNNLEYLNSETEGGLARIRQKIDTMFHKRASKVDDQKKEKGHMAEILGKTVDNARKLRGGRYERIFFEESGSDPILLTKWNQAQALVQILGKKIGTRFAWGTGGDEGPYLAALEKMFLFPHRYGGLAYKHNHTKTGEFVLTGFFVPADTCVMDLMDARGVTDPIKGREYYDGERLKKADDAQNLLEFCSEYCYFPEEALSRQGQNDFNQVKLAEQHTDITIHKKIVVPRMGRLFWVYETDTDNIIGVKWTDDPEGDIWMSEEPQTDSQGIPLKNLYCAGIDGIDVGIDESVVGEAGSKFAILVKKRTYGNVGNKYVCGYMKRPNDVREAYTNAAKILWWYGCKGNLEDTKIGFRTWLRDKKMDIKMMMNRPNFALDPTKARNESLWGTPGSEKMIRHGLGLVKDYIEDYHMHLNLVEIIEQLQKFSYEFKGKFDWVSAMLMTEIADEDMYNLRVPKEEAEEVWEDIGYWKDEYGRTQFGIIPNNNAINYGNLHTGR